MISTGSRLCWRGSRFVPQLSILWARVDFEPGPGPSHLSLRYPLTGPFSPPLQRAAVVRQELAKLKKTAA